MKALSIAYGVIVAGIVVCFGMTVYTGIRERRALVAPSVTVPPPALGR